MPVREKRAAATRAHSNIKMIVLEDRSDEYKDNRYRNPKSVAKKTKTRRQSSTDNGHDRDGSKSSIVFEFDSTACVQNKKRRPCITKNKKRPRKSEVISSQRGSKNSSTKSDHFSGSSLSSTSEWINRKHFELEMSTDEDARMERQRRRSLRLINSTGPMLLSYRTSYRMEHSMSPTYSPITSCRLRFTPVAHIPTTPVVSYIHGELPKRQR
jgi:hypothetical protein